MSVISKPRFPDVAKLPGVPQLLRSPRFPPGIPPALGLPLALGRLWQSISTTPEWGLYDAQNNLVLEPDSFLGVEVRNEWQVSTFPVQAGSFAAYNKVDSPLEISVKMSKGGTQSERETFLRTLEALSRSIQLFSILTPERTYASMNICRYEVSRRGAQGAYFLAEVEVFFREIRQVTPQYVGDSQATENARDPSAVGPVSQGQVQPLSIPARIAGKVRAAITGLIR